MGLSCTTVKTNKGPEITENTQDLTAFKASEVVEDLTIMQMQLTRALKCRIKFKSLL